MRRYGRTGRGTWNTCRYGVGRRLEWWTAVSSNQPPSQVINPWWDLATAIRLWNFKGKTCMDFRSKVLLEWEVLGGGEKEGKNSDGEATMRRLSVVRMEIMWQWIEFWGWSMAFALMSSALVDCLGLRDAMFKQASTVAMISVGHEFRGLVCVSSAVDVAALQSFVKSLTYPRKIATVPTPPPYFLLSLAV